MRWIPAAIVIYAVAVSTIGAALVASRLEFHSEPRFLRLLSWQSVPYLLWGFVALPMFAAAAARAGSPRRAVIALTVLAFVAVGIVSPLVVWWSGATHPDAAFRTSAAFSSRLINRLPIDILIASFAAGAVLAWTALRQTEWEQAARALAEKELARVNLHVLKSRLRPHFLFNTLHTTGVLIEQKPEAAQEMLHDLAALLRLTLDRHDLQLTTLEKELEAARLYLAIQQVRFGERLKVVEEVDESLLQMMVPDFLLQPLIENAVIHGVGPLSGGATLVIGARDEGGMLNLEIRNDGAPPPDQIEEGVGIVSTRSRLEALYGNSYQFSLERVGNETVVRIRIPRQVKR